MPRNLNPTHDSHLRDQWWKCLIAGAALLVAVIVAAGVGVEAWFIGLTAVFAAIALVATGLALWLARLVMRRLPSSA